MIRGGWCYRCQDEMEHSRVENHVSPDRRNIQSCGQGLLHVSDGDLTTGRGRENEEMSGFGLVRVLVRVCGVRALTWKPPFSSLVRHRDRSKVGFRAELLGIARTHWPEISGEGSEREQLKWWQVSLPTPMLASPGEVCHVEATNFSSNCGIPVEEDTSDLACRLKI